MSVPTIFGLLHVSQRAMFASQLGVHISNHNIANINTTGYVRQQLMLTPSRSVTTAFGEVGMGVQLDEIRRVTDEFLQAAMHTETSEYSGWSEAAGILDRVEILTGIDESTSLSAALANFFESFGQLATDVQDGSVRTIVVNSAVVVTERFNSLATGLDELENDINTNIERQAQEVSSILAEIAELNGQVIAKDTGEATSNDLRTRREQLMTELSELVEFTSSEDNYGAVDIYISGRNVVHRDSYAKVRAIQQISVNDATVEVDIDGMPLAAELMGGSLGSLIETRDNELASIREELDRLASTIIDRVNELHVRGFSPAGSGVQFFEGSDAGTIQVFQLLRDRPEYVAHSYNNTAGDNSLANDLADLGGEVLDELGGRSILSFYADFIGDVGSLSETAKSMAENKELTCSELMTRIESVSGVSLDEEIANVTRYQTMYEASARMINIVNEMLDSVLSLGV